MRICHKQLVYSGQAEGNGVHGQQKAKKRLKGKLSPSIPSPVVCGLDAAAGELTAS